ncbi:MAG TPA: hypothetical protein VF845_01075 [Terriglobales bacterium]
MRKFPAIACLFFAMALNAQKAQDFSGVWHIIPDKVVSKVYLPKTPPDSAPPIPPPPPPDHEYTLEHIRLSGQVLKISGGEAGTTAVYTIDPSGKEVSDPIPDAPGSIRTARSHWSEGKLVTEWKMLRDGEVFMHGTDTRSLTADGQQIVERVIESPRHRADVRLVLEKTK